MTDSAAEAKRLKHVPRNSWQAQKYTQLKATGRKYLAKLLSKVRTGPEHYMFSPPLARGGNWLYEWLKAYVMQQHGEKYFLVFETSMEPWIEEFPKLKELTASKDHVKFRSQRSIAFHQNLEEHFPAELHRRFISEYLLSSPRFFERVTNAQKYLGKNSLVINIRRGDYYSVPEIKSEYGIPTIRYVHTALEKALSLYTPSSIFVVSDDLKWCSENLDFLKDIAPTSFTKYGSTMYDDLAMMAAAPALILTNSTFSYWGGYIAHCVNKPLTVAPAFHSASSTSLYQPQSPIQHMPDWVQITSIGSAWIEQDD
ncbi:alpha-1,2-fucosyltransferase [Rothia terrae]|uniref:alpha-1,2-fucosyltransferase n=1 Tax=Rothia terrae TaxID=396015 RepID=UPI003801EA35